MRLVYLVPLLLFIVIGVGLAIGLTLNPHEIPSALIGKPVPQFALPPAEAGGQGLSTADLKAGHPSVVNVFASWCVPGRVSIDWGVYGVPETFIVDGGGMIVCKHVGPLTEWDMDNKIKPVLRDLKAGRSVQQAC